MRDYLQQEPVEGLLEEVTLETGSQTKDPLGSPRNDRHDVGKLYVVGLVQTHKQGQVCKRTYHRLRTFRLG